MEAVVDCVVQNTPPPPELMLAWQCSRWKTLPESGGLYEQDYQTMYRMTALSNIHNVVTKVRMLKGKQIHQLTDTDRKILRVLYDNKVIFHA